MHPTTIYDNRICCAAMYIAHCTKCVCYSFLFSSGENFSRSGDNTPGTTYSKHTHTHMHVYKIHHPLFQMESKQVPFSSSRKCWGDFVVAKLTFDWKCAKNHKRTDRNESTPYVFFFQCVYRKSASQNREAMQFPLGQL